MHLRWWIPGRVINFKWAKTEIGSNRTLDGMACLDLVHWLPLGKSGLNHKFSISRFKVIKKSSAESLQKMPARNTEESTNISHDIVHISRERYSTAQPLVPGLSSWRTGRKWHFSTRPATTTTVERRWATIKINLWRIASPRQERGTKVEVNRYGRLAAAKSTFLPLEGRRGRRRGPKSDALHVNACFAHTHKPSRPWLGILSRRQGEEGRRNDASELLHPRGLRPAEPWLAASKMI